MAQNEKTSRDSNPASRSVRNVGRYRSFLRLKALGMAHDLGARVEASDIVQQTMLEAHRSLDQFRGKSEPEMAAWLTRMLNNNMTDAARAMRRQKRDVSKECSLDAGDRKWGGNAAERVPSDQTTPSLCVSRIEDFTRLHAALASLPEHQREVIKLHHLQGQSLADVSRQIGRSQSAVAGLLFRGLRELRTLMN